MRFLLEHDRNPLDLWVDDDPLEIARDRGYSKMEQLLTHRLETRFNASSKGEPVALALAKKTGRPVKKLELRAQDGRLLGLADTATKPRPAAKRRRHVSA